MIDSNYIKSVGNRKSAEFAMSFDKKSSMVKELYNRHGMDNHARRGFGNYNSKIVMLFKDMESYKGLEYIIEKILEKFNINIYDLYIMFANNNATVDEEISIISPSITYVFFEGQHMPDNIKTIVVPNLEASKTDAHYVFDCFKHLVTYSV